MLSQSVLVLAVMLAFLLPATSEAQSLVIGNARIITGTGRVIEHGTIMVNNGMIVSITDGSPPLGKRGLTIDATGLTVMAGYIDCHRHLLDVELGAKPEIVDAYVRDKAPERMRELLASGVTTVQSGGDDTAGILRLKHSIESGQIVGPSILTSAWVPTALMHSEAEVRAAVDSAQAAGADSIAEIPYPWIRSRTVDTQWPFAPTSDETRNLAAAIDEGRKIGIPVQLHAVSPPAQLAVVRLGGRRLIHASHYALMTDVEAKEIAATGAMVATSTGVGTPVFGVFNTDGRPTYRDGKPWPAGNPAGEDRGQAAGKFPVNARTLYDNGVTLAYSSDTSFDATASLAHELATLNLVFSPLDMIRIIGPNLGRISRSCKGSRDARTR